MSDTQVGGPAREVELKLAVVGPSARAAAGREIAGARSRSVETIYYDTPGRRLREAGFSLRLRRDGERWSQSLKASGGDLERFEKDHPLPGGLPDFSLLADTPVAELAAGPGDLAPIFLTRVQRRSRKRLADGARIEFSLDEGEVIAKDRSCPILELELELKGGESHALFAEGRRLAQAEAFVPDFLSKGDRGFALMDGALDKPAKFNAAPLDADLSAVAGFQVIARRCLRQLAQNAGLETHGARLEAIHQARTALRRLRVAMGLFKPVLAAPAAEAVERELLWLTGELADARNYDVLVTETFRPAAGGLPDRGAAADLGHALLAAQERAHERARAALVSSRFRLLLLDAVSWIESAGESRLAPAGHDAIADLAQKALAKSRRRLLRRIEGVRWADPFARHKLRIAAKKMRYASEFFIGLGPDKREDAFEPFVAVLEKMQSRLGRLNDLAVAEHSLVAAVKAAVPGTVGADALGFSAGLIMGAQRARLEEHIRSARRASHAFREASPWW
jgi:inorganic triphosphatase YgiF